MASRRVSGWDVSWRAAATSRCCLPARPTGSTRRGPASSFSRPLPARTPCSAGPRSASPSDIRSSQMTVIAEQAVTATGPNSEGYREYTLGEFHLKRDEYFVYLTWPTGHHIMSIDAFLRALQRDVAWDFFY